jgi:hypothetical protein
MTSTSGAPRRIERDESRHPQHEVTATKGSGHMKSQAVNNRNVIHTAYSVNEQLQQLFEAPD